MSFKEKVMKTIIEMGEEKTIEQISNALATRAFFQLKKKFEILERDIIHNHDKKLIEKIDGFERTLEKCVKDEVTKQTK